MQPAILCQHFPLLAHHSRATLVPLTHSTAQLGALFGIPRLAVFAIRVREPFF